MSDMKDKVVSGVVSYIVSIVLGVVSAALMAVIGFVAGDFVAAWTQYPYPLGLWTAAVFSASFAIGWALRTLKYKWSDDAAKTAARIEMEKAEHAEKMRRDRDEYEKRKAREAAERKAAEQADLKKKKMVDDFKKADPFAKKHIEDIYRNGSKFMTESNFRYSDMYEWADYESRYYDAHGNMIYEVSLFDETRKMLDDHPELLK